MGICVCAHFLSTKLASNPIPSVHASLEEKGEGEEGGIGGGGGQGGEWGSVPTALHNIEKQREIKSFVLVFSFFVAMCRPGWGSVGPKTGEVGGRRLQDFFATLFTTRLIFVCVQCAFADLLCIWRTFFLVKFVVDIIFDNGICVHVLRQLRSARPFEWRFDFWLSHFFWSVRFRQLRR